MLQRRKNNAFLSKDNIEYDSSNSEKIAKGDKSEAAANNTVNTKSNSEASTKQIQDFESCNVNLKPQMPNNRKRSAFRFLEESLKDDPNIITNSVRTTKDPINKKEGPHININNNYNDNINGKFQYNPIDNKKNEFESRRKKNPTPIIAMDYDKKGISLDNNNNLNKILDKDMIIGDSTHKKGYLIGSSANSNSPTNNNGGSMFGIVESRRHMNIGTFNNIQTSKIGNNIQNCSISKDKDKGRNFMKI
jgi:hypothetical protein